MQQIEPEQAIFSRKSVSPTKNRLQVKLSGRVAPGPRFRAPRIHLLRFVRVAAAETRKKNIVKGLICGVRQLRANFGRRAPSIYCIECMWSIPEAIIIIAKIVVMVRVVR